MLSYEDSILALELTDYCNCSCVMCTQSVESIIHGTSKGFISLSLVEDIFESLARNGVKIGKLLPFGLGESTIHKNFKEIMEFIFDFNKKEKIFSYIDLHTNGIEFNESIQDLFIKYGEQMGTITFSLDSAREETFYKIRGNKNFKKSRSNVMEFFRKRKELKKEFPHAILQFIVMEDNYNDLLPFVNFWKNYLKSIDIDFQINYDWNPPMVKDTIFLKRVNPFSRMDLSKAEKLHKDGMKKLGLIKDEIENSQRIIESNEFFEEKNEVRKPCSGPFKYINIAWDGVVTICCIDTQRKLAIGKIGEDGTIVDIWENRKNKFYRDAHISGDLSKIPICERCRNLDGPLISDDEIITYLKKNYRFDEIDKYKRRMGI